MLSLYGNLNPVSFGIEDFVPERIDATLAGSKFYRQAR